MIAGTGNASTVDPREVARFGALADEWWDPAGKMGMLHKFNPVRLSFIKEAACRQFERDPKRLAEDAAGAGLKLDYRATTAEALAQAGERFDLVLAMEVVEHVADLALFVQRCAEMVKPRGLLIGATINRTLKSFALAIVGAEYVLRWLPRGTHRWDKFVTPDEFEAALERRGLRVNAQTGVVYDLFADRWQLAPDMDVNYMLAAEKLA